MKKVIENLEYENRNMAKALEMLGFNKEQIDNICNENFKDICEVSLMDEWESKTKGRFDVKLTEVYREGGGSVIITGRIYMDDGWYAVEWFQHGEIVGVYYEMLCKVLGYGGFSKDDLSLNPKWKPEIGEPVWVRNCGDYNWVCRVFARHPSDDKFLTFDQQGRFSGWDEIAPFNNGKPPKE